MYYTRPIRPDELYHHGIKGMHWGIRRYQNPDGTLTAEGRRHQNIGEAKAKVSAAKKKRQAVANAYTAEKNRVAITKADRVKRDERVAEAEKNLNAAKSELKSSKQELKQVKKDNPLTDKQKRAIKTGAVVAGTALAVYGGYKLSKAIKKNNANWKETRRLVDKYVDARNEVSRAEKSERVLRSVRGAGYDIDPKEIRLAKIETDHARDNLMWRTKDMDKFVKTLKRK